MTTLAQARHAMVEGQVRTDDVTDRRIVDAMASIPREAFAPRSRRSLVYAGASVEIAPGRYLTEPRTFAKMAQALEAQGGGVALVVGAGGGYAMAVMARLFTTVVGVECDEKLAAAANTALAAQAVDNAAVIVGPLPEGAAKEAPFDAILIDGAIGVAPTTLLGQLREGGKLIAVEDRGPVGKCVLYVSAGGATSRRVLFDAAAPLLPGFEPVPAFSF